MSTGTASTRCSAACRTLGVGGAAVDARGSEDHRPFGGLQAQGCRDLWRVVRRPASGPGAARRGGVRPDRVCPALPCRCAAGRVSRLLPDRCVARRAAAGRGRAGRPVADQRQRAVRRLRRRPQPEGSEPVPRGRGGGPSLRHRCAPPHARNRAGDCRLGRHRGADQLHAAPRPDQPRRIGDDRGRVARPAASPTCARPS